MAAAGASSRARNRRRFLRFLAGAPWLAGVPGGAWQARENKLLANPKAALNVMDFEAAAQAVIPPAHFGFLTTGVDDDATLNANHEAYKRIQLRPRRLIDVRRVDTRGEVLGTSFDHPILLAPCASHKAFHPEGEVAVARAARAKNALLILSTQTTCPIEQVARIAGQPIWFQLYATTRWEATETLVRRAEAAGCPVLVLTVDLPAGRNTETLERFRRMDDRPCATCHSPARRKPMFEGIDMTGLALQNPAMDWAFVRRLKDFTRMKLVLKGIETREDAQVCRENGVDGIIVSNHGGRAEESGRGTIECLPEVLEGAGGRMPVLVDGGIRRGTDILKALALGARAVCIGRPYLWGLGAFGQPGVERVLEILRAELELVMKQCGARSLAEITQSMVTMARS